MTRIGGPGGPKRPSGPKGPGRADGPDKAKGAGFVRGLSGPEGADATDAGFEITDATYGRMRSKIKDALDKGLPQEEILEQVIHAEIEAHFGGNASPEMSQSVSEAFQGNSQLQSLFNQLLARVRDEK